MKDIMLSTIANNMIKAGTLSVIELCNKLSLSEGSVTQWLGGDTSKTSTYVEEKVRVYLATIMAGSTGSGNPNSSDDNNVNAKKVGALIEEHDADPKSHEALARKNEVLAKDDKDVTKVGNDFNQPKKLLQLGEDGGIPESVRVMSDNTVVDFGEIAETPTFKLDTPHVGFLKKDITLELPTAPNKKLKNILFDFNITPNTKLTYPENAKWDYDTEPDLAYFPDISYSGVTIDNLVVTCSGTNGQYADLNIPFNNLGTKSWEMIWNLTPSDIGIRQYIISHTQNSTSFLIGTTDTNHFLLYLSGNNSTWNIASSLIGTYTLSAGLNVYVKLTYDGYSYTLSVSSDGRSWATDINVVSPYTIDTPTLTGGIRLGQQVGAGTTSLYKGIIDLTRSSVSIAGGNNLLTLEDDIYLNRIIWDTMSGGKHYKSHYSQVEP